MKTILELMKFFFMLFNVVHIIGEIALDTTFNITTAVSQM